MCCVFNELFTDRYVKVQVQAHIQVQVKVEEDEQLTYRYCSSSVYTCSMRS